MDKTPIIKEKLKQNIHLKVQRKQRYFLETWIYFFFKSDTFYGEIEKDNKCERNHKDWRTEIILE